MTYTPEQLREEAFREFEQWFIANYPGPETIISDPAWHAPKIFRSATHRQDKAHAAALEELARLRARLEIDFATDGNGKRVPFPTGGPDGIACRDETIRILESALADAEWKYERLRFYAEAMAKDLELSYEVGKSSLAAYRAEFKDGEK